MLQYMTHMQRAKSKIKDMLGNNILKFFRPALEDKVEKLNGNFGGYCKVPNLVVREHMKFIKTP